MEKPEPSEQNQEASSDHSIEGHSPAELFRAAGVGESQKPDYSGRIPSSTSPGAWDPPPPGEVDALLPGLEVTGLIGRGGMGAVYRGLQTSLDRPVAIKLLPPELAADPEFEARFRREAKSMAKLNHPHIVQIYDFGQTSEGHFYFVMEYVDGTDLHHLIQGGHLDATGALNAICQICDALSYAHENGFVHRDIKPGNIFINSKGILKVGDFGLAKLVQGDENALAEQIGLTQTGYSMGTPHYVAPEQLFNGTIDQRADIYSLGVMFYEMLTGGLPMGNFKPPTRKVAGLDPRLDAIVARAMEENPEDRYQSTAELRAESTAVLTTAPPEPGDPMADEGGLGLTPSGKKLAFGDAPSTSLPSAPNPSSPGSSPPRSRRPVFLTVGLLVPLLAIVIFVLLQTRKSDPNPQISGDPPGEITRANQGLPLTPDSATNSPVTTTTASPTEKSSPAVSKPGPTEDSGAEESVKPQMAATLASDTPPMPNPDSTIAEADSPPSPTELKNAEPAPVPTEPLASAAPTPGNMPPDSSPLAEPAIETDPVDRKLEEIDAKYQTMFEVPYQEALSTLNVQFSKALERQEEAAMRSGSLTLVTAFRDEATRIGNGNDAGPIEETDAPPELRQLRQTWHQQVGQLREQRFTDKAKADAALDQALLAYQQELVREKNLDGARKVAALRDAAAKTAASRSSASPDEGEMHSPKAGDAEGEFELPLWLRKSREAGGKVHVWGMIGGEEIDERSFLREFTGSDYQKVVVGGGVSSVGVLGVRRRGNGVQVVQLDAKDPKNPTGEAGHLEIREHDEVGAIDRRFGSFVSDGMFWHPSSQFQFGTVRRAVGIEMLSGNENPASIALESDGGVQFWGVDPDKPEMVPFFEGLEARINESKPLFVAKFADKVYWQGTDLHVHGLRINRQERTIEDVILETQPGEPLRLLMEAWTRSRELGEWIALGTSGTIYSEKPGGFETAVATWPPAHAVRSVSRTSESKGFVLGRPDGTWLPVGVADPELVAFIENLGPTIDLDVLIHHDNNREVVTRIVAWIEPDSNLR